MASARGFGNARQRAARSASALDAGGTQPPAPRLPRHAGALGFLSELLLEGCARPRGRLRARGDRRRDRRGRVSVAQCAARLQAKRETICDGRARRSRPARHEFAAADVVLPSARGQVGRDLHEQTDRREARRQASRHEVRRVDGVARRRQRPNGEPYHERHCLRELPRRHPARACATRCGSLLRAEGSAGRNARARSHRQTDRDPRRLRSRAERSSGGSSFQPHWQAHPQDSARQAAAGRTLRVHRLPRGHARVLVSAALEHRQQLRHFAVKFHRRRLLALLHPALRRRRRRARQRQLHSAHRPEHAQARARRRREDRALRHLSRARSAQHHSSERRRVASLCHELDHRRKARLALGDLPRRQTRAPVDALRHRPRPFP